MPLTRTVLAWCDHEGCTASMLLNPNTSQPWLDLIDQGWTVDTEVDDPLTYCPDHHNH